MQCFIHGRTRWLVTLSRSVALEHKAENAATDLPTDTPNAIEHPKSDANKTMRSLRDTKHHQVFHMPGDHKPASGLSGQGHVCRLGAGYPFPCPFDGKMRHPRQMYLCICCGMFTCRGTMSGSICAASHQGNLVGYLPPLPPRPTV